METQKNIYKPTLIKPMTKDNILQLSEELTLYLSETEAEQYLNIINPTLKMFDKIYSIPEDIETTQYKRCIINTKSNTQDYNAWATKCKIEHSNSGSMKGLTCAIKDTAFIQGVPCQNGSRLFEDFIPNEDAEVVKRLLDNGCEIQGKSKCEDLCFSGGNVTCFNGPVLNPVDTSISSGGSSSGSAALVSGGIVDVALAGDQGGSIRIPAASCKVIGFKPTYGLVPLTGQFGMEYTFDHAGPIARSTENIARFMDAVAGTDGQDFRYYTYLSQSKFSIDSIINKDTRKGLYSNYELSSNFYYGVKSQNINFHDAWKNSNTLVSEGFSDGRKLRIGILSEGLTGMDDHIKGNWEKEFLPLMTEKLESLGVDKPEFFSEPSKVLLSEMFFYQIVLGFDEYESENNFSLNNRFDRYSTHLSKFAFHSASTNKQHVSPTNQIFYLIFKYLRDQFGNAPYVKGNNIRRELTKSFLRHFEKFDLILMPTFIEVPPKNPTQDVSLLDLYKIAFTNVSNTSMFNLLGLPALTIDLFGQSNGKRRGDFCPIMIAGNYFEDHRVIQFARFIEESIASKYKD